MPPRARFVGKIIGIASAVTWLETSVLDVSENPGPEFDAVADCNGIGVWGGFVRAADCVLAPKDHLGSASTVPLCQLISPIGEGKMHGNSNYLRKGLGRRGALEEILIPVSDVPVRWSGGGNRC